MRGERRAFLRVRRAGLPLARSSKRRRRRLWLCGDRVRGAQAPPPPLDRRAGRGKRGERKEGRPRGGGGGGPSGSSQPAPRRGFGSAPSPAQPPSLPRSRAPSPLLLFPPVLPSNMSAPAAKVSKKELNSNHDGADEISGGRRGAGGRGGGERGGRRAARAPRPLSLRRRRAAIFPSSRHHRRREETRAGCAGRGGSQEEAMFPALLSRRAPSFPAFLPASPGEQRPPRPSPRPAPWRRRLHRLRPPHCALPPWLARPLARSVRGGGQPP